MLRLLAVPDALTVANTRKKIDGINGDVMAALGSYDKLVSSSGERQAFENLRQVHRDYLNNVNQLADLVAAGKVDEGRALAQAGTAQLGAKMNESTEALRKIDQKEINRATENSNATYSHTKLVTWVAHQSLDAPSIHP